MPALHVAVQTADFDISTELAALRRQDPRVGAVCCLVGTVRECHAGDTVSTLELEHYPGMTERTIMALAQQAISRFGILGARIIHRVGRLQPSDHIVLVAVTAIHRAEAFTACEFLMDHLKMQAPFWKKEHTLTGARWLDARSSDAAALARWQSDAEN
ncbi:MULTISPECIES: molybdenum cofactor biosynthesis protein MoaE [Giesbergeria]|uniref:Molybdopterin synthase catalytic subunit n=1 Tax=Giesbergeria sinuosa TaxID=80883 RepID=A0ABV9QFZ9_9BURK